MTDGLLSPEVGVAMWAVTAGATAYGIKKITDSDLSEKKLYFALYKCFYALFNG